MISSMTASDSDSVKFAPSTSLVIASLIIIIRVHPMTHFPDIPEGLYRGYGLQFNKIPQQILPHSRQYRLRMELHPFNLIFLMPYPHNLAFISLSASLQTIRNCLSFYYEGMIPCCLKWIGKSGKYSLPIVAYHRCLAMHQPVVSYHI